MTHIVADFVNEVNPCRCRDKDEEIEYLKAIIALHALNPGAAPTTNAASLETIDLQQQIRLMQHQLLVMRADVQYMNHEVQSIFDWISKLITVFLRSCGRLGESTASAVIDSASKVSSSLARLAYLNTP